VISDVIVPKKTFTFQLGWSCLYFFCKDWQKLLKRLDPKTQLFFHIINLDLKDQLGFDVKILFSINSIGLFSLFLK
jgi:hypothetical protein